MCRIPIRSAFKTALLQVPGGELVSDWKVPKPTIGIKIPEGSVTDVFKLVGIAICVGCERIGGISGCAGLRNNAALAGYHAI